MKNPPRTTLEEIERRIDSGELAPPRRYRHAAPAHTRPACTSDACNSGDLDCPTPDACRLPDRLGQLDDVGAGVWRWCLASTIAAAIVCALVTVDLARLARFFQ